jgi:hypothetical protein
MFDFRGFGKSEGNPKDYKTKKARCRNCLSIFKGATSY